MGYRAETAHVLNVNLIDIARKCRCGSFDLFLHALALPAMILLAFIRRAILTCRRRALLRRAVWRGNHCHKLATGRVSGATTGTRKGYVKTATLVRSQKGGRVVHTCGDMSWQTSLPCDTSNSKTHNLFDFGESYHA